jgi:hypothetical protein
MTTTDPRALAVELIRATVRDDIDLMGVGEFLEDHAVPDSDDGDLAEQVHDLIGKATVTATWPAGVDRVSDSKVAYSTSDIANEALTAAGCLDGRMDPIPGIPDHLRGPLAQLLQHIGDHMSDGGAHEQEHPDHRADMRWLAHADDDGEREHWTDALRLARALLGRPDPNVA